MCLRTVLLSSWIFLAVLVLMDMLFRLMDCVLLLSVLLVLSSRILLVYLLTVRPIERLTVVAQFVFPDTCSKEDHAWLKIVENTMTTTDACNALQDLP